MERTAKMGSQAGVKWSREDFGWGRIEPAKGKFDWTFYDKMVSAAKRNGITIYGELGYWTGWTKPYTPEGIEDYCRYVTAVAAHYRNDVHHWEIWNEPNISWYDFRNDGSDPFNFEHNMGIITRDFRPKPAYRAYATMTRMLRGLKLKEDLDLGKGVVAFRFAAQGKPSVTALWSTSGDRTVGLPASKAMRLTGLMGDTERVPSEDGKVNVPLRNQTPVFLSECADTTPSPAGAARRPN